MTAYLSRTSDGDTLDVKVLRGTLTNNAEVWRQPIEDGTFAADMRQALPLEVSVEVVFGSDLGLSAIQSALAWLGEAAASSLFLVLPGRPEIGPLIMGARTESLSPTSAASLAITLVERITVSSESEQVRVTTSRPRDDIASGVADERDDGKQAGEEKSLAIDWIVDPIANALGGG